MSKIFPLSIVLIVNIFLSSGAFAQFPSFRSNGMEYAYGQGTSSSTSVMTSSEREILGARREWLEKHTPRPQPAAQPAPYIWSSEDSLRQEIQRLEAEVAGVVGKLGLRDLPLEAFREFQFYSEQIFNRLTNNTTDYKMRIGLLKQILAYATEVKYYPNPNNIAYNAMARLSVSYEDLPRYFQDLGREYFIEVGYVQSGSKSCRVKASGAPKRK